ncbi:hypothetical protein HPB52_010261 [Rhipicephalus sanguineus]|uniref:Uncharacterized protein n=1 Tax=Rhipicephalus sanguineus TaxID=34632 RepID=A0A9D4PSF2_RHISA|nr:hypothetical protein HPB52_010261 [Rhipicephalus sanguineus]
MAKRKFPVSLYRLRVVSVSDTIHSLWPAHEDIFANAFPLHVSKDLVVQSFKQQIYTSLHHLPKRRLSRNGLRYIEHRLPTAILSRRPRLVREAPSHCMPLVELSLVGTMSEDDRSLVDVLIGQLPHLRRVTQCRRNVTDHAQVPVAEELSKPTFSKERVTDSSLYQLVTCQRLLESEMCFDQRITVWSSFDLLRGLPCQQTAKIPFLTKAALCFPEGCKLSLVEYMARYLGLNDRTPGVTSTLKLFFLEQAKLGLELVGTMLKTLTLRMFACTLLPSASIARF